MKPKLGTGNQDKAKDNFLITQNTKVSSSEHIQLSSGINKKKKKGREVEKILKGNQSLGTNRSILKNCKLSEKTKLKEDIE